MKKNVVLLIAPLAISTISFSQSLSPSIVSTQSGYDKSDKMILEWTLGENSVETLSQKDRIYSQGFHQPLMDRILDTKSLPDDVFIYPNPVKTLLNIQILQASQKLLNVDMYDVQGRLVKHTTTAFMADKKVTLSVEDLPTGIYILQLTDSEGTMISHKIIKL